MDLTNKTLLRQLNEQLNWKISRMTLWIWVKKNYIKPSSYIENGNRKLPIYYQSDFPHIVNILRLLRETGKVKIKGYDNETINRREKRQKNKKK